MRASRLVSLLLLLQARGGMTAAELAEELEVSVRTIHRDVEALGAAGVPIYAERGPHGGIRLVDGYRTRLTGMTTEEADALFLSGLPGPAAELGLGTVVAAARLKVLAALPAELRGRASRGSSSGSTSTPPAGSAPASPCPCSRPIAECVWEGQRIELDYDRGDGIVTRIARSPRARAQGRCLVPRRGATTASSAHTACRASAAWRGSPRSGRSARPASTSPPTGPSPSPPTSATAADRGHAPRAPRGDALAGGRDRRLGARGGHRGDRPRARRLAPT